MSTFDAALFENMVIEGANETHSTPVPEGDYTAIIDKVQISSIEIKNGDRAGQTVPILNVTYHIMDDDGALAAQLNRDKITVRQMIWLDVTDKGTLAFGPNQNLGLGRVREAAGLNNPNKPFAFKQLEGQGPVRIAVTHRTDDERGLTYDQVSRVSKAS